MKKTIALLLALLLALLPQSALAVQEELVQNEIVALSTEDMEALLSGIVYENKAIDISTMSDQELADVLYAKLHNDFFHDTEGTYLERIGVEYRKAGDTAIAVDLELVQRITRESFGRDFPEDVNLNWIYALGQDVLFEISQGGGTTMSIQEWVRVGDAIFAVGTAVANYGVGSYYSGHFLATMEAAPGTVYGCRLISLEPVEDSDSLRYITAEASSELIESKNAHLAANVLDGDKTTAWCEDVKGVGINEWILLRSNDGSKMHISAIEFMLGYHKSQDHLDKNGVPWEFLVEAEGNYTQKVTLDDMEDCALLNTTVETQWIKFTILNASAGSKFEDTCISEIKLHGIDADDCLNACIDSLPEDETTEPEQKDPAEQDASEPEQETPVDPEQNVPTTDTADRPTETTAPSTEDPTEESTGNKNPFFSTDKDDKDDEKDDEEDDDREDRKDRSDDDEEDPTLLLIAVTAAGAVIIILLVVLIIVASKKKKR